MWKTSCPASGPVLLDDAVPGLVDARLAGRGGDEVQQPRRGVGPSSSTRSSEVT